MKFKTIELFCGTKSFSKVMQAHGHSTFTIDSDESLKPDCVKDINLIIGLEGYSPKILWASPPCTAFSVASIGKHWGGGYRAYEPISESAELGISLVKSTIRIINQIQPTWWFVENPRGVLRKMPFMQEFRRVTVTYCQYGDIRMKPTDIWTNATWWNPKPMCKNGDKCHVSAPRGSRTGTQGLKGAKERGVVPPALFEEILNQML